MKLINDFFQIISTETVDGGFKCRTRLNANHDYYRVHFPGNPVTPGVCLLQMATEILSQEYGKKLVFCKGSNIKFKSLVGPHEEPRVLVYKNLYGRRTALYQREHRAWRDTIREDVVAV